MWETRSYLHLQGCSPLLLINFSSIHTGLAASPRAPRLPFPHLPLSPTPAIPLRHTLMTLSPDSENT